MEPSGLEGDNDRKAKIKKSSSWLVRKVSKKGVKKDRIDRTTSISVETHNFHNHRKSASLPQRNFEFDPGAEVHSGFATEDSISPKKHSFTKSTLGNIEEVKVKKEKKSKKLSNSATAMVIDSGATQRPALPKNLQEEIAKFSMSSYAENYFQNNSIKKHRFAFKKMPKFQYAKTDITTSILALHSVELELKAVELFNKLMHYMGDKSSPLMKPNIEFASSILSECIQTPEIRDEFYCQLIKQTTKNPNPENEEKAWELFAMALETFLPSQSFDQYLKSYFGKTAQESNEERIRKFALCCFHRIDDLIKAGPKVPKLPTNELLKYAKDLPYLHSCFHDTLEGIVSKQSSSLKIPLVLSTMIDYLLSNNAHLQPNIFRNATSASDTLSLKLDLEYNNCQITKPPKSPYVVANTLKLWLKEIRTPIIPSELYHTLVVDTFPLHITSPPLEASAPVPPTPSTPSIIVDPFPSEASVPMSPSILPYSESLRKSRIESLPVLPSVHDGPTYFITSPKNVHPVHHNFHPHPVSPSPSPSPIPPPSTPLSHTPTPSIIAPPSLVPPPSLIPRPPSSLPPSLPALPSISTPKGSYKSSDKATQNFKKFRNILWKHLPDLNRLVLIELINFLQKVAEQKAENRMTEEGLAVVISPNLCRCPEENPVKAAEYGKYEKSFVMTLILMLDEKI